MDNNFPKISIYVATHKRFKLPKDADRSIYIPILCGSKIYDPNTDPLTPDTILPELRDDTGYNISDMNRNYCELTAMYWAWKNDRDSDVLGLNHYRRYFVKPEDSSKVLNREDIINILYNQGYDAIMQGPGSEEQTTCDPKCGGVYECYKGCHVIGDMDKALVIIKELYPELSNTFEHELKENIQMCICNMMIAKKEVFKAYCEFIFKVYYDLEVQIDHKTRDSYQQRALGFLSERLMRPFMVSQGYKFIDNRVDDPVENNEIEV